MEFECAPPPADRLEPPVSSPSAKPDRPCRLLWGSQLVSVTGTQMQVVALDWHVCLLTHSPPALGLVGLSRVLRSSPSRWWAGSWPTAVIVRDHQPPDPEAPPP
jgi:hypothetical protein